MKIVTGHRGENHVTSTDFQALNQGVFGEENYVLNVGNKFAATMPDATHVIIQDGEGVMQGVHFRTERGTVDSVEIDAGSTGLNRIDLVGALYEKDNEGVESITWSVVKGTSYSGGPMTPTYDTGDILVSDSPVFFPIFKITLTGVTPVLSRVARTLASCSTIEDRVSHMDMDLLWTNNNVAGVSELTVDIGTDDYDFFDIYMGEAYTVGGYFSNNIICHRLVRENNSAYASYLAIYDNGLSTLPTQVSVYTREIIIHETSTWILFRKCYHAYWGNQTFNISEVSTELVPFKIYGGRFSE